MSLEDARGLSTRITSDPLSARIRPANGPGAKPANYTMNTSIHALLPLTSITLRPVSAIRMMIELYCYHIIIFLFIHSRLRTFELHLTLLCNMPIGNNRQQYQMIRKPPTTQANSAEAKSSCFRLQAEPDKRGRQKLDNQKIEAVPP